MTTKVKLPKLEEAKLILSKLKQHKRIASSEARAISLVIETIEELENNKIKEKQNGK